MPHTGPPPRPTLPIVFGARARGRDRGRARGRQEGRPAGRPYSSITPTTPTNTPNLSLNLVYTPSYYRKNTFYMYVYFFTTTKIRNFPNSQKSKISGWSNFVVVKGGVREEPPPRPSVWARGRDRGRARGRPAGRPAFNTPNYYYYNNIYPILLRHVFGNPVIPITNLSCRSRRAFGAAWTAPSRTRR